MSKKGPNGFQKRGLGLDPKHRNEGTKTGTGIRAQKKEQRYKRLERGHIRENCPFTKRPFCFLSNRVHRQSKSQICRVAVAICRMAQEPNRNWKSELSELFFQELKLEPRPVGNVFQELKLEPCIPLKLCCNVQKIISPEEPSELRTGIASTVPCVKPSPDHLEFGRAHSQFDSEDFTWPAANETFLVTFLSHCLHYRIFQSNLVVTKELLKVLARVSKQQRTKQRRHISPLLFAFSTY